MVTPRIRLKNGIKTNRLRPTEMKQMTKDIREWLSNLEFQQMECRFFSDFAREAQLHAANRAVVVRLESIMEKFDSFCNGELPQLYQALRQQESLLTQWKEGEEGYEEEKCRTAYA